jgi:hypothetical protein
MTSRGAEANDWSNITDRVVKKRIQNRIAQRNYRKLVSIQMTFSKVNKPVFEPNKHY